MIALLASVSVLLLILAGIWAWFEQGLRMVTEHEKAQMWEWIKNGNRKRKRYQRETYRLRERLSSETFERVGLTLRNIHLTRTLRDTEDERARLAKENKSQDLKINSLGWTVEGFHEVVKEMEAARASLEKAYRLLESERDNLRLMQAVDNDDEIENLQHQVTVLKRWEIDRRRTIFTQAQHRVPVTAEKRRITLRFHRQLRDAVKALSVKNPTKG